jgi:predicted NBD/HSP70 family sugar kinase
MSDYYKSLKGRTDDELISGKFIFNEYYNGDEDAIKVVNQFYDANAYGVISLAVILDPDVIVLGGAISSDDKIFNKIKERVEFLKEESIGVDIVVNLKQAEFGNDANLIGAIKVFNNLQK